ncbi:MAG: TMEM43 family protein [Desulfovibrio sp.]|nr:TMEM43 family protein [Desulfovibrio sp.]
MEYTETTTTSWFSRLKSSLGGVVFGIILIIVATGLLWWNEGDFVKTRDALNEAQGQTVELSSVQQVDPAANGKLVHATGFADTNDVLRDPVFGIGGKGIALHRKVEFYQWTEHSKSEKRQKLGGGEETVTTYSYKTDWVAHPVKTENFHSPDAKVLYVNSTLMNIDDLSLEAKNVHLGAYRLAPFQITAISGEEPFTVNLDQSVREQLTIAVLRAKPQLLPFSTGNLDRVPLNRLPQVVYEQGNTLYVGATPAKPEVGDVRITFTMIHPANISLIAKTSADSFEPYVAANGKNVSALTMGTVPMEEMFASKHSSNKTITWIIRVVGTLLVILGIKGIFAPLAVLVSVIPALGTIVGAGAGIVSTLLGLAWSLIIMSIAWLRFRPAIGGTMLAVAALMVALLYVKGKSTKNTPAA